MIKSILHFWVVLLMWSLVSTIPANAQEVPPPPRGVVIIQMGNGTFASGVELQKDGKILVAASSYVDNQGQSILLRRNAVGSPDQPFGKASMVVTGLPGFYIHTEGMALQEDGKIVLAGRAIPLTRHQGSSRSNDDFLIIRYNPDGQLDTGFNGSGWVQTDIDGEIDVAYGLALQKDRKIVVVGNTSKWTGYHFAVLRYNANGSLDRGFGKKGQVITRVGSASEDSARAVAIQEDGKILVAGKAHRRYDSDMAIVRYRPDGKIDSDFGLKGKVMKQFGKDEERIGSIVKSVTIQPDGKIIVGINLHKHGSHWKEGRLMRYNPDGTLDPSFGADGMVTVNRRGYGMEALGSVALQDDGKILFTGGAYDNAASSYAIVVGRSHGDGSPDTSFGNNGFTQVWMGRLFAAGRKIAIQPDGKIVVAGDVGKVDPHAISYRSSRYPSDLVLFRLNADGQLDKNFGSVAKK